MTSRNWNRDSENTISMVVRRPKFNVDPNSITSHRASSFGHQHDHSISKDLVTASTMIVTAEAYCDSPKTLCVIFTILVSFSRDNVLFASKAKINIF